MSRLLVLPVAIPLLAAALTLLMRSKLAIQRALSVAASAAVLAFAIALVARTAGGEALAARIGGFPGPFAISFAADTFSALMLTVAALMVLVCTAFAIASRDRERPLLHPLILVLEAGVSGSFLTADLFNLFVFFEVMLISSYVLLTLGGSKSQVRSGTIYVATNLLGSTILLAGVGLTYAIAGTVNMASLASLEDPLRRLAVPGAMLLIAFAVKAALVPVHGWLPSAYPSARPAVAALFSGLLTKVGVYALYR
ncbi:MAG TPA: proton-conducting transporter membrane subunit, partial [Actinomycetota bacterium]|nr:proton-conducting transporter membrane subunit [Actinomycetota bacterium]